MAYAGVMGGSRSDAAVESDHRRRGIGTALGPLARGRRPHPGRHGGGRPRPLGSDGDRLLEKLGYRVRWTSWVLALPDGTRVPERALPDGYAIRAATPEDHEPWMLRVVTGPAGEVVGTACLIMAGDPVQEASIERLAVRRDQRGRGLAQALLVDAFEQGRRRGAPRSGLSTDSLSLYEEVGMVVTDTWVNRGIDL